MCRSSDCGLTWTPPNLIADSDDDDRDAAFGVSSQGTLILLYQREHKYDADGNYQGGLRISDPKPIALMATRSSTTASPGKNHILCRLIPLATASFYGKIVSLDDGTLLAPIYNSRSWADEQSEQMFDTSYLVRSR